MADITLTEENHILTVAMHAPKNNLMTGLFHEEFEEVMEQISRKAGTEIHGLIFCGNGRHFSVGADVAALAERAGTEIYDDASGTLPESHKIQKRHFTFLRDLPFPVISVVTGFCIGSGSEIALNCHYRITEKGARIGQPESTFGILPGLGGIARTIELCGMQKAYELVMTGRLIPAEEAFQIGWADILTEKKQGLQEAFALIQFLHKNIRFQPECYREYIRLYQEKQEAVS